jgi:hypothetical protein
MYHHPFATHPCDHNRRRALSLRDIYQEGGFSALKRLAEASGADAQYLRQCATGWRGRQPSPRLAKRLIAADPRLSLEALYAVAPAPRLRKHG